MSAGSDALPITSTNFRGVEIIGGADMSTDEHHTCMAQASNIEITRREINGIVDNADPQILKAIDTAEKALDYMRAESFVLGGGVNPLMSIQKMTIDLEKLKKTCDLGIRTLTRQGIAVEAINREAQSLPYQERMERAKKSMGKHGFLKEEAIDKAKYEMRTGKIGMNRQVGITNEAAPPRQAATAASVMPPPAPAAVISDTGDSACAAQSSAPMSAPAGKPRVRSITPRRSRNHSSASSSGANPTTPSKRGRRSSRGRSSSSGSQSAYRSPRSQSPSGVSACSGKSGYADLAPRELVILTS